MAYTQYSRYSRSFLSGSTVLAMIFSLSSVFAEAPGVVEFPSGTVEDRINDQVDSMRSFSPEESLDRLYLMTYYEWPGCFIRSGIIREDEAGRSVWDNDVMKVVWSNRLFRKCFAETAALSKEKAAAIISAEIKKTLPLYLAEYEPFVAQGRGTYPGNEQDGKPTLLGLRYKLFALSIIAGSLELTDAAPMVRELAELAVKQKEKLAQEVKPEFGFGYLIMGSLHNVYVLSSGLYGTTAEKEKLAAYADRWTERKLVDYTAAKTEFDRFVFTTPVPDKECIAVRWLDKSTDADVIDLLRLTKPEEKE